MRCFQLSVALALILGSVQGAPAHLDLADRFLEAFRDGDKSRQALLAAKPAHRVAYALTVEWMLSRGHRKEAAALADMRGGPEREGLKRLVQAFVPASDRQVHALQSAAKLASRDGAAARRMLADCGPLVPGTLWAARVEWVRAGAFATENNGAAAGAAFGRCAALSKACGWIERWQRASVQRLRYAATRAAADDAVAAALAWGEPELRRRALRNRAAVLTQLARRAEGAKARDLRRLVRTDLVTSIELAMRAGKNLEAGRLERALAFHWQVEERDVRMAVPLYRRAIKTLGAANATKDQRDTKINLALALRRLGQYEESLALVDGMVVSATGAEQATLRAQRAYLLGRLGRIESAAAAYDRLTGSKSPASTSVSTVATLVEAGELFRLRGDRRRAQDLFERVLKQDAQHRDARIGIARTVMGRGADANMLQHFAEVSKSIESRDKQMRVAMLRAVELRHAGHVRHALTSAMHAVSLVDAKTEDLANAAIAWLVAADLKLLRGDTAGALDDLARGATILYRLKDSGRAATAYLRESLVLVQAGRLDDATKRAKVLAARIAEPSGDKALRAMGEIANGMIDAKAGRVAEAMQRLDRARDQARDSGRRDLEAAALVASAIIDPQRAGQLDRALALLDEDRTSGPEEHPVVIGERGSIAASVGLAIASRRQTDGAGARAYAFAERIKRDRILIAAGGRLRFLESVLPVDDYRAYLRLRGSIVEARATDADVAPAVAAHDGWVKKLRETHARIAQIAFPQVAPLAEVQAALRDDELLVLMVDDAFVRALVAMTKTACIVAPYAIEEPLAAAKTLANKDTRWIVAPDGAWSGRRLPAGPRPGLSRTRISSAAALVAARRPGALGKEGAKRWTAEPRRLTLAFDHPAGTRLDQTALPHVTWKQDKEPSGLVYFSNVRAAGEAYDGMIARGDAAALIYELLAVRGTQYVAFPMGAVEASAWQEWRAICLETKRTPGRTLVSMGVPIVCFGVR